jgi:hypothetical protein
MSTYLSRLLRYANECTDFYRPHVIGKGPEMIAMAFPFEAFYKFFSGHPLPGVLIVSACVFEMGRTYSKNGKEPTGLLWKLMGVIYVGIYTGVATFTKAWFSLAIAASVLALEIWLMLRTQRSGTQSQ